jgi:hypothetical protein
MNQQQVLGKKIVEVIMSQETWIGLVLEDGTKIYADGGEDAHGGYGFLEIENKS